MKCLYIRSNHPTTHCNLQHFNIRLKKEIFEKNNTETHVALRGNYSTPVRVTNWVEVSKDAASLLVWHSRRNFWLGGCGFFVSDVISGWLLGHLGLLYLALGANS